MRFMNTLADRALSLVAPKTTAGACIPPDPWTQYCSCTSYRVKVKNCSYNCKGTAICGACYNSSISC